MSKQYNTCPYCGANLDPGERCDCSRASPGGCKKCTHAKSAPVQIVHPNLPGHEHMAQIAAQALAPFGR